jgi:transcriptional regulator with XRE-family HTH domain
MPERRANPVDELPEGAFPVRQFSPEKVRACMRAQAVSAGKLADRIRMFNPRLNTRRQTVERWIRHGSQPTADYLAALAFSLGVTMEDLFDHHDPVQALLASRLQGLRDVLAGGARRGRPRQNRDGRMPWA